MQPCPPRRPAAADPIAPSGWARAGSRALHPASPTRDEGWLWAVASGLASVASPWELPGAVGRADAGAGAVEGTPGGPADAELVLATPLYEAWLQSWPVGSRSDEHGHLDAAAFCVVAGTLEEWEPGPGGAAPTLAGRHGPGEGRVLPPGARHVLVNVGPVPATALHVSLPAQPTV